MSDALNEADFQRVSEAARKAVRNAVLNLLLEVEGGDAHQATILGGLAGAVEAFACACGETVTRDRMREALRGVVDDFAGQAFDEVRGLNS